MTKFFDTASSLPSYQRKTHGGLYLFIAVAANAAIWTSTFFYLLLTPPTYTSKFVVGIRGVGSRTDIRLPELGAASSVTESPFENRAQDPRESYKLIAQSPTVVKNATEAVGMEKFGKARVQLIDSTPFMSFEIPGDTPEEAQNKAYALLESLEEQLNQLRDQESQLERAEIEAVLETSQRKLEIAQKRLSDYKENSGLVAPSQITELSDSIENLRRQKAEMDAERQQLGARYEELISNLKISPADALDSLKLQNDDQFRLHQLNYHQASAALTTLIPRYGANHPSVVEQRSTRDAALAAMLSRSQDILGRPTSQEMINRLNLDNKNDKEVSVQNRLAEEMIGVGVRRKGAEAQAQEVEQQVAKFERKLQTLGGHEAKLEALRRDVQIAEAVFSSSLTKLDVGTSDLDSSYPPLQSVTEPSLPTSPNWPNKKLVLLGAFLGSFFLTTTMGSLWLREWLRNRRLPSRIQVSHKQTTKANSTQPEVI